MATDGNRCICSFYSGAFSKREEPPSSRTLIQFPPHRTSAAVLRTDSPLRRALLAPGRGASAESQSKHEPISGGRAGGNEVERSGASDSAAGDVRATSPTSGGGVCGVKLDVGVADEDRTGRALDTTAASKKRTAEDAVEGDGPSLAQKHKVGA